MTEEGRMARNSLNHFQDYFKVKINFGLRLIPNFKHIWTIYCKESSSVLWGRGLLSSLCATVNAMPHPEAGDLGRNSLEFTSEL